MVGGIRKEVVEEEVVEEEVVEGMVLVLGESIEGT